MGDKEGKKEESTILILKSTKPVSVTTTSKGVEEEQNIPVANESIKTKSIEIKLQIWDLILKVIIPIITAIGGIFLFFLQQEKQDQSNFQRDFWLKKFEMYSELSKSIGEIQCELVTRGNPDTLMKKNQEFKIIYYKVTLVQDSIIDSSLIAFNDNLDKYLHYVKSKVPKEQINKSKESLTENGVNLINLCKKALHPLK